MNAREALKIEQARRRAATIEREAALAPRILAANLDGVPLATIAREFGISHGAAARLLARAKRERAEQEQRRGKS